MNQSLPNSENLYKFLQLDRRALLAGFLRAYGLTYAKLGRLLGVSPTGAHKMFNAQYVSRRRLKQILELPYPFRPELLPEARERGKKG